MNSVLILITFICLCSVILSSICEAIANIYSFEQEAHEINAADLLSIFDRHTGQLVFILAEQSSHRQTCPRMVTHKEKNKLRVLPCHSQNIFLESAVSFSFQIETLLL